VNKQLIPPEGISFGFAIRGARDTRGVAAVNGGIKYRERGRAAAGPCVFDTDEPVVRIILTIMKFDPVVRCAALLQFSERAIGIFENDLFLECASLDANTANLGISTMDWGIASCCKEGVPDVCYDTGGKGKEAIIRLFGEEPNDVSNNIIMISNRIISIEL